MGLKNNTNGEGRRRELLIDQVNMLETLTVFLFACLFCFLTPHICLLGDSGPKLLLTSWNLGLMDGNFHTILDQSHAYKG